MKLTTLFATLSILLIAFPAFGVPNLVGIWCVSYSDATSATGNAPDQHGVFSEESEDMVIDGQSDQGDYIYGTLFYGHVEHAVDDWGYFSGVLDGETISFTHWDSVTRGTLKQKGNKPLEIHFINNAFFAEDRGSKTAIGVAVKGECTP